MRLLAAGERVLVTFRVVAGGVLVGRTLVVEALQVAVRQRHLMLPARLAARCSQRREREGLVEVEGRERGEHRFDGGHAHERLADDRAAAEALRVPRAPLAHLAHADLVAEESAQAPRVVLHDRDDRAQIRRIRRLASREHVGEFAEEPGTAQATAPDDHAVTTAHAHHAQRVEGLPDVAVA